MTYCKKSGPKTPWQNRVRYNRARCVERLKPSQIQNLASADAFSDRRGYKLNTFVTIKFGETGHPLAAMNAAVKRLSQWFRRWGGELRWIFVWEAIGGPHVHALAHCPPRLRDEFSQTVTKCFEGHDVHIRQRTAGPAAMAYLCKGTDVQTHLQLRGHSQITARRQGAITWKRCGNTENIGLKSRQKAGFNCAETYTHILDTSERQRIVAGADGKQACYISSLVVLQSSNLSSHHQIKDGVCQPNTLLPSIPFILSLSSLRQCPDKPEGTTNSSSMSLADVRDYFRQKQLPRAAPPIQPACNRLLAPPPSTANG